MNVEIEGAVKYIETRFNIFMAQASEYGNPKSKSRL